MNYLIKKLKNSSIQNYETDLLELIGIIPRHFILNKYIVKLRTFLNPAFFESCNIEIVDHTIENHIGLLNGAKYGEIIIKNATK